MALTHTNNWITEHIHMLSFAHCSSLREAVKADIKEARPTVRRKPPVQQLKAEIAAAVEVFCHCPPIDLPKHIDILVNKLRQLSAV
jgi:hypothetical protein